jgi:hypothetical protein
MAERRTAVHEAVALLMTRHRLQVTRLPALQTVLLSLLLLLE